MFFSPANHLVETGRLATPVLFGLIPGMEIKTLWMPPAYLLYSSSLIHLFSDSLTVVRLGSSIAIYFSLVCLYFLTKSFGFSKKASIIVFSSIILEPLLFRFGSAARMEGLTALFFLMSLLFVSSETTKNKRMLFCLFGGVCLSLSCLSHPFGASLGIITLFLLFYKNQNWKLCLIFFGIGGILPILVWVYYIYPDFDLFILQFGSQLVRKKTLFQNFSLYDKLRVFLFGFAFAKFRLIVIGIQIFLLSILSFRFYSKEKSLPKNLQIYWVWVITVLFSLYSSSEGWYVIHSLFPLVWGMGLIYDNLPKFKVVVWVGLLISLSGIFQFTYIHWYKTDSNLILKNHFEKIEQILQNSKSVYLQALPDPYFYLRTKRPNLTIREFIPGELGIPSEVFLKTIHSIDAFVFYNDDLRNSAIKDLLKDNSVWSREEWDIPVPTNHWLHYKTIVYTKTKN
ncbi:dolichyl-phosphate-mannose--protein mannosyltransferase [Leptospira sp. 96542]|nr:dolichyl-phosphate-mannose--protein mannosyltransferase [Leptospira sp. 96542]